jgi:hypothetical protein
MRFEDSIERGVLTRVISKRESALRAQKKVGRAMLPDKIQKVCGSLLPITAYICTSGINLGTDILHYYLR